MEDFIFEIIQLFHFRNSAQSKCEQNKAIKAKESLHNYQWQHSSSYHQIWYQGTKSCFLMARHNSRPWLFRTWQSFKTLYIGT